MTSESARKHQRRLYNIDSHEEKDITPLFVLCTIVEHLPTAFNFSTMSATNDDLPVNDLPVNDLPHDDNATQAAEHQIVEQHNNDAVDMIIKAASKLQKMLLCGPCHGYLLKQMEFERANDTMPVEMKVYHTFLTDD